jgi:hypothetical protein
MTSTDSTMCPSSWDEDNQWGNAASNVETHLHLREQLYCVFAVEIIDEARRKLKTCSCRITRKEYFITELG